MDIKPATLSQSTVPWALEIKFPSHHHSGLNSFVHNQQIAINQAIESLD